MTGFRIPAMLALSVVLLLRPAWATAAADNRLALVIGNSSYQSSPLKNPVNDATDMAAKLEQLRFRVILKTDVGQEQMEAAIREFGKDLHQGGIGLFYFAGHGMQVDGHNYLIPVDAKIESESDVRFESVDAGRVLGKMEDAGNDMNIVILDACRDNPFARSYRSGTQGLARMDAPKGSIIAYATSPGSVAADGLGKNGIYTQNLLAHIDTPGLSIEQFFKNVRVGVIKDTGEKQVPWESSSLTGDFYFSGKRGMAVAAKPSPAYQPAALNVPAQKLVAAKAPAAKKPEGYQPPGELDRAAPAETAKRSAAKPLVTNALGMNFVFVPPGSFMMGSPDSETGREPGEQQHRVTLSRGFFIQTTEVTQRQWESVMGDLPADFHDCGADCPVEMVSWKDAAAFIEKLNRLEGGDLYRLPTEAEWEYACRAGKRGNGDNASRYAWTLSNAGGATKPVGKKKPNPWGLYDMLGNVSEWCQDRYGPYETGRTVDPTGARDGLFRVFRGGAWSSGPLASRTASRDCHQADFKGNHLGFRLVRNP